MFGLSVCGLSVETTADTFVVSSSQCTGSGSFSEAVSQANANTGPDVISINPGLIIDATGCPYVSFDPKDYFLSVATDDLTIEGNNAQLKGSMSWVTSSGNVTPLDFCPLSNTSTILVNKTPGFFKLAPGVDVVVENLRLFELNTIANVQEQANLTLDNVEAERILTIFNCRFTPAISAGEGASVTIRDNTWSQVLNWGTTLAGVVSDPAISGQKANSLIIENSRFLNGNSAGGFIWWEGDTVDSKVLIVSSEMSEVGGIVTTGNTRTHMVNSLWATKAFTQPFEG